MKWLLVFAVILSAGLAGVVFLHERGSGSASGSGSVSGSGAAEKIMTISSGETVDIDEHLADGVRTVVEFSAVW